MKYLMEQMWERQKNILYTKAFPEAEKIDQSLKPLGNQNGNKTQNAVWLFLVNYWRRIDGSYLSIGLKRELLLPLFETHNGSGYVVSSRLI